MVFTEKTHAYVIGLFYKELVSRFADKGVEAFKHATRYYGNQRGRRMAQRAIKDGVELSYSNYCRYSEWAATKEVMLEGCSNKSEIVSKVPDYVMKITVCPWHNQFMNMNLHGAGVVYCANIDKAIAAGFNPEIRYEVEQSLFTGDHCLHRIVDCNVGEDEEMVKKQEYIKSFEYHSGHALFSFSDVTKAIFKEEGTQIVESILDQIKSELGQEAIDSLMKYKNTDFNVID